MPIGSGYKPPPEKPEDIDMSHDEEGLSLAEKKSRVFSHGLTSEEASQLLIKYGRNELEDKKKSKVIKYYYILNKLILINIIYRFLYFWNNYGHLCL